VSALTNLEPLPRILSLYLCRQQVEALALTMTLMPRPLSGLSVCATSRYTHTLTPTITGRLYCARRNCFSARCVPFISLQKSIFKIAVSIVLFSILAAEFVWRYISDRPFGRHALLHGRNTPTFRMKRLFQVMSMATALLIIRCEFFGFPFRSYLSEFQRHLSHRGALEWL